MAGSYDDEEEDDEGKLHRSDLNFEYFTLLCMLFLPSPILMTSMDEKYLPDKIEIKPNSG